MTRARQPAEPEVARDVPIRSLSRGIAVLTALNRSGPMPMMAISKSTDLPYPTVNRIVQTLLFEGLVEREPTRKYYRVTPLVSALSSGYQTENALITAARPHIERLCSQTAWPVSLATRVGTQMVLRDSTHVMTSRTFINYFPGYTMPIAASASGKVYLSFCSDAERRALADAWGKSSDAESQEGLQLLADDWLIKRIRAQQYAFNVSNFDKVKPGRTSALSVPIIAYNKYILSSLTLVYFSSAMSPDAAVGRYVETMLSTAKKISCSFSEINLLAGNKLDLPA